jgi:hypothetical protein
MMNVQGKGREEFMINTYIIINLICDGFSSLNDKRSAGQGRFLNCSSCRTQTHILDANVGASKGQNMSPLQNSRKHTKGVSILCANNRGQSVRADVKANDTFNR